MGANKKAAPVLTAVSDFEEYSDELAAPVQTPDIPAPQTLADFDKYRVTKEKHIPDTPPLITIGSAKVAAPCNVTPITAEGKAGKTAINGVFIAGAISRDGVVDGLPGVEVVPNHTGKAVIHFDTEQSEADQQSNLRTILKRAHMDATPDYYHSYNIRTLQIGNYQDFTSTVCKLCSDEFGGVHMIVIDGGADYIESVNDEAQANAIIHFFTCLAVQFNCAVLLVIHLNENAGKNGDTMPRGHVGRQAVRKGYAQLNITKEADISTLQVLRARKAGSADTPLIHYKYCKEIGYHVSVDQDAVSNSKQTDRDMAGRRKAEKVAQKVLGPLSALLHKDIVAQIMKATGKSEATAKRYLGDLQGWGIVLKHDDGYYRLFIEGS